MKFSVVIPNYGDVRIDRCLASLVSQSYKDVEIIVVDGFVDENRDLSSIYQRYSNDIDILIVEKDHGIFDALNKGIAVSTGEAVFLIGADDFLSSNTVFEEVASCFSQNSANSCLDGVCIDCRFVDKEGKVVREWNHGKISYSKFRLGILPPHFSLFLKRSVYDRVGLFDVDFSAGVAGDTEWLFRFGTLSPFPEIVRVFGVATVMEVGGTSTGSFRNILKGAQLTGAAARKHKYQWWFAIPVIKIFSKLRQFKYV